MCYFCWVDRSNEGRKNTIDDRNIHRENPEADALAEEKVMASLKVAGLKPQIVDKIYRSGGEYSNTRQKLYLHHSPK